MRPLVLGVDGGFAWMGWMLVELGQVSSKDHLEVAGVILVAMRTTDIPDTFQNKPIVKLELWRHLL